MNVLRCFGLGRRPAIPGFGFGVRARAIRREMANRSCNGSVIAGLAAGFWAWFAADQSRISGALPSRCREQGRPGAGRGPNRWTVYSIPGRGGLLSVSGARRRLSSRAGSWSLAAHASFRLLNFDTVLDAIMPGALAALHTSAVIFGRFGGKTSDS